VKAKRKKISAVVITKNEEKNIKACLKTLAWTDELIVVDNESSDKTAQIAKRAGARVVKESKKGFSVSRNRGIKEVRGDWILYLDADERVSSKLQKEIESKIRISKSKLVGFAIPRKNILLGREMKHGGWWPDYVLRLIKKDALKRWEGELHEQPKVKGKVGKLKNPLIHFTHRTLFEMVEKTNEWSEIEAKLLFKSGHPKMNLLRFVTAGFREFWYRGVKKMGFLDGVIGIIEIIYQTFSRMITYTKLWEMQVRAK